MEILKIILNESCTNKTSIWFSSVRTYIKTAQTIPDNSCNQVLLFYIIPSCAVTGKNC